MLTKQGKYVTAQGFVTANIIRPEMQLFLLNATVAINMF